MDTSEAASVAGYPHGNHRARDFTKSWWSHEGGVPQQHMVLPQPTPEAGGGVRGAIPAKAGTPNLIASCVQFTRSPRERSGPPA